MDNENEDSPREAAGPKGSAGLVCVTMAALVMAAAVAILPVWLGGLAGAPEGDVWQAFYADLHPLLLPIPIGVFFLILAMEVCGLLSFGKWKPQTTFPLFVGVVSAVAAAIAGNFMHLRVTGSDGVAYHHIWGFTVFVVLAILAFVVKIWANHTGAKSPIYGIMLVLAIGALGFTGVQGGVLGWKDPFEGPAAHLFGKTEPVAVTAPEPEEGEAGATEGVAATPPAEEEPAPPAEEEPTPSAASAPPVEKIPEPAGQTAPAGPTEPAGRTVAAENATQAAPAESTEPPAEEPRAAETPVEEKAPPATGGGEAKISALAAVKPIPDRLAYEEVVKPILRSRCYECHAGAEENPLGKKKIKGSLVMTSIEDMKEGGSEAEALVPGDLEASLMSVRIHLPMDDDEHMPPEDKDQLAAHEIAILDWWITAGAPTVSLKESKAGPEILAAVGKMVPPEVQESRRAAEAAAAAASKAEEAGKRKKLEAAMVETAREFPNALTFISRESSDLQFTAVSMRKDFTDEKLVLLKPVGSGLVELNLGATSVTDAGLGQLETMPNLRKLHLQQTGVTDAGLDAVARLENLEWLNLFGTEVTDAGIRKLEALPKLKKLYLWGTKVTPEGAKALKEKVPGCEVNLGTEG